MSAVMIAARRIRHVLGAVMPAMVSGTLPSKMLKVQSEDHPTVANLRSIAKRSRALGHQVQADEGAPEGRLHRHGGRT